METTNPSLLYILASFLIDSQHVAAGRRILACLHPLPQLPFEKSRRRRRRKSSPPDLFLASLGKLSRSKLILALMWFCLQVANATVFMKVVDKLVVTVQRSEQPEMNGALECFPTVLPFPSCQLQIPVGWIAPSHSGGGLASDLWQIQLLEMFPPT